jgi:hypothetical protein
MGGNNPNKTIPYQKPVRLLLTYIFLVYMILKYCRYEGLGKTLFLLNLLVVEAGVEVVVADGVVAVAPLPHKVLIFTPCNALIINIYEPMIFTARRRRVLMGADKL